MHQMQSAGEFLAAADALMKARRPRRALEAVGHALALEPMNVKAHLQRARILRAMRAGEDAAASALRAVALAPEDVEAWRALGVMCVAANRLPRALAAFERALAFEPDHIETLNNVGWALTQLQRYDAALGVLERGLTLAPGAPSLRWNRGLCLLAMGRFAEGLEDYEARFALDDPSFERLRRSDVPLWRKGEAIAGKRVFLYNDQGHGDTIQFIRFARTLRRMDADVIAEVQPELADLCASVDDGVRIVRQRETPPAFDLMCPMASLPHRLSLTAERIPAQVPYLRPDVARVAAWRVRLSDLPGRMRVGLAWAGNARHANDANRSIPLRLLEPLLGAADVSFVSLQKEMRPGDVEVLTRRGVVDHTAALTDFSDTAALIANLNLVITVDTSVAHLAGALGVPVWIFVPFAADFRWMAGRDDSPWYPTARLFRQPRFRDWESAIAAAGRALLRGQS
jgi:tetratricopeptide (TPR) repeat protein